MLNLVINYYVNRIRDSILYIKMIKYPIKVSRSLLDIFNKIEIEAKLIKTKKEVINSIKSEIK